MNVPKSECRRRKAGEINDRTIQITAGERKILVTIEVAAPRIGTRMSAGDQPVVGRAERPVDVGAVDRIGNHLPTRRAAFQIVKPRRCRRLERLKRVKISSVIIRSSVTGLVATDDLITIRPIRQKPADRNRMVCDQSAHEGDVRRRLRQVAILHGRIRRLGSPPSHVRVIIIRGRRYPRNDWRPRVNAGCGGHIPVVRFIKICRGDRVAVGHLQLVCVRVSAHEGESAPEQSRMRRLQQSDGRPIRPRTGDKTDLRLAGSGQIRIANFHQQHVVGRVKRVVEEHHALAVGAGRKEIDDVPQQGNCVVGCHAVRWDGVEREREENDAAWTVHAGVRITHPTRFAGHGFERNRRGVGRRRECVGKIRPQRELIKIK